MQGMSLLEVLLASALAVVIISTLTSLYVRIHHHLLINQQYITESLTAMRLLALFKSEIESAGHIGCAQLAPDFMVQTYGQFSLTKENSLRVGVNDLSVQYQAMPTVLVLAQAGERTIVTDDGAAFDAKEIVVISDCAHAEINEVKSVNVKNNQIHLSLVRPLQVNYAGAAEVGHLIGHHYYLQQRGTHSDLVQESERGRKYVLQSDITNLQFESDGRGVSYSFRYKNTFWSGYAATA